MDQSSSMFLHFFITRPVSVLYDIALFSSKVAKRTLKSGENVKYKNFLGFSLCHINFSGILLSLSSRSVILLHKSSTTDNKCFLKFISIEVNFSLNNTLSLFLLFKSQNDIVNISVDIALVHSSFIITFSISSYFIISSTLFSSNFKFNFIILFLVA